MKTKRVKVRVSYDVTVDVDVDDDEDQSDDAIFSSSERIARDQADSDADNLDAEGQHIER